jgi:hypothetical protein
MKIHPLGRVPAPKLDDGSPLTENTAELRAQSGDGAVTSWLCEVRASFPNCSRSIPEFQPESQLFFRAAEVTKKVGAPAGIEGALMQNITAGPGVRSGGCAIVHCSDHFWRAA